MPRGTRCQNDAERLSMRESLLPHAMSRADYDEPLSLMRKILTLIGIDLIKSHRAATSQIHTEIPGYKIIMAPCA